MHRTLSERVVILHLVELARYKTLGPTLTRDSTKLCTFATNEFKSHMHRTLSERVVILHLVELARYKTLDPTLTRDSTKLCTFATNEFKSHQLVSQKAQMCHKFLTSC